MLYWIPLQLQRWSHQGKSLINTFLQSSSIWKAIYLNLFSNKRMLLKTSNKLYLPGGITNIPKMVMWILRREVTAVCRNFTLKWFLNKLFWILFCHRLNFLFIWKVSLKSIFLPPLHPTLMGHFLNWVTQFHFWNHVKILLQVMVSHEAQRNFQMILLEVQEVMVC